MKSSVGMGLCMYWACKLGGKQCVSAKAKNKKWWAVEELNLRPRRRQRRALPLS